jgi:hypothetical protein
MISETILNHVYSSLAGLKDGEAGRKAAELAAYYGVKRQTVFRWAAKTGLRWRKERADKGKTSVPKDSLLAAGAILNACKRTSQEIPMPACDAKEILEDSGIDTGGVSTRYFLAKLRENSLSARDLLRPPPHQTLLSEHPNQVWQFDVTNCIQYFLDDKGMGERDADMTLYKNKIVKTAKQIKKELLRYVAVDHCTGAFYFRYFYASGEKARDGADFLFEAMRPKDELIQRLWPEAPSDLSECPHAERSYRGKLNKYHFHGVPFMLVTDKGSIVAAKANQALLDSLRVKLEPHLPGNPRAKGAVEGLMHIINRFEARLKLQRPGSLEELNRWALDWCIMFNAVRDMRGVAPRSAMWSRITKEQLRLCPDEQLYRLLIREPTINRRADGARLISLDGMKYQVPDPNCVKQWVNVVRHPFEYPAVEVHFNGYVWLLQPIPVDEYGRLTNGTPYGEYKAVKHTETQSAQTEMEKIAVNWGLTWKGTGNKRRAEAPPAGQESPLKVFGHQADKVKVDFINRAGSELEVKQPEMPENKPKSIDSFEVERSITPRLIPISEFLIRLVKAAGPISKELNQQLRAQYGENIEFSEAEEVIREMASGFRHRATIKNVAQGLSPAGRGYG